MKISLYKLSTIAGMFAILLAACAPAAPAAPVAPVEVTRIVEVAAEPVVQEVVVTATPAPVEKDPNTPVRIGFFVLALGNSYEEARVIGATEAAAKFNATTKFFVSEFDPIKQNQQIDDAVTSGNFDVLIVHCGDCTAVVPPIENALKAGLIVIAADSPIGPNVGSLEPYPQGVSAVIGRTAVSFGTWIGKTIVDACEGIDPCQVTYLVGAQSYTADQVRYEALQKVTNEYSKIKIVSFQEGKYDQDISRKVMQNVFQSNPDINVVASSGDQMTLGAILAAEDAGLKNIKFIGAGASKLGCQAISDGKMLTSYADIPHTQGIELVKTAVAIARGQDYTKSLNLETLSPPLPSAGPMISKGGLENFICQW